MPHTKFRVEILTPEGEVFNDEVEMVSTRTTVGEIGILANHEPVLGMLEPTELRLYRSDDEILRFAQSEGYMQVGGNHAMLLVQDIQTPEELDAEPAARAAGRGRARARGGRRGHRAAPHRPARPEALAGVPQGRRGLLSSGRAVGRLRVLCCPLGAGLKMRDVADDPPILMTMPRAGRGETQ